jgi:flagellar basal body-associated protein FliL
MNSQNNQTSPRKSVNVWVVVLVLSIVLFVSAVVGIKALLRSVSFLSPPTVEQIKRHVNQVSDLDKLQRWATKALADRGKFLPADPYGKIDISALPSFVQNLKPGYVFVYKRIHEQACVDIVWKGSGGHYGLLVGPNTYHTKSWQTEDTHMTVHRWCDGVYIYYGGD